MHFCRTRNLARASEKALRHACNLDERLSFALSCVRELPYFGAQKKTRLSRDLSAKQNTALGKLGGAAGFYEGDVTFIFHFDENVTVALCKTKALILIGDSTSGEQVRSPRRALSRF